MAEQMRLVAIGGGGPTTSSRAHVNTALDMSGKSKPNLLYIPTPKRTKEAHDKGVEIMTETFGRQAGLPVKVMHDFGVPPSEELTFELLEWADTIYISGGDTAYAYKFWFDANIACDICNAVTTGEVTAAGISAGLIIWFKSGCSDSNKFNVAEGETWDYTELKTFGVIDGMACPHYNTSHPQTGKPRSQSFAEMMFGKEAGYVGWGVDNLAALQIVGLTAKVLSADGSAMAHKLTRTSHGVKNITISPTDGLFTI